MHEIVCRSTKGLLRTGIWEGAICDRRMHMLSQYPRESRSKARTGTGAHNPGAAGNRPCGQARCIGMATLRLLVLFSARKKTRERKPPRKLFRPNIVGESVFHFSTFRRFGSSRYRRATLATELGGRSNLPKWIFPISLRFVPSFFLLR